ncbi:DUF1893 domain-containing protein [Tyzzerella nexilis]|nr:DUF1893 domain-containing protein [[Clostridium] nexile]
MNDRLEQAVALLKEKQVSCVIWIEGKEPILSDEIGIKPLMKELRKERHAFEHGVIADKVVGKAAALMAILGGAKAVYGQVLSESAEKILQIYGIEYAYEEKVPYIENRTKTGQCPLEESVISVDDPEKAFEVLEETIAGLMRKNFQRPAK